MTDPAKPTSWYPRPKKVKLERYLFTQDANGKQQVYKAQNEGLMQAWLDAFKPGREQGWYDDSWQAATAVQQSAAWEDDSWAMPQVKRDIGTEIKTKIRDAEVLCDVRNTALEKAQVALEQVQAVFEQARSAVKNAELVVEDASLAAKQAEEDLKKVKLEAN